MRHGTHFRRLAEFRYEIRRFLNFSEHAAREAGVEPQQHQALLAITDVSPGRTATVGFLAERLQVEHHSACELSDRLQEKGLIRRTRSVADRREVLLELTRRGEKVLQRLSESHRAELRTAGPKLIKALRGVIAHSRSRPDGPRDSSSPKLHGPHSAARSRKRAKLAPKNTHARGGQGS